MVQRWSFFSIYELAWSFSLKKNNKIFLWKRIPCLLSTEKFLFWTFRRWKIRSFFDPKSWWKMIFSLACNIMFTKYEKVLDLKFLGMENTVFFWSKKLMETWYLLGIFELSMIFQSFRNIAFAAVNSTRLQQSFNNKLIKQN